MAPLLALAGFMGSGKSAVGIATARRLGWSFVDLDQEIESSLGVSIEAYFAREGEKAFRAIETEALLRVVERHRPNGLILALGGGTLERQENRTLLSKAARIVLLQVDAECAWDRVAGSERPLAHDPVAFGELWARRQATYETAADWVLPTSSRDVGDVAGDLCEVVESSGAAWSGLWGRRLVTTERPSLVVGGEGALSFLGARADAARQAGRALHVVSDKNVMRSWGSQVLGLLGEQDMQSAYVVEPGETSKSAHSLLGCWDWLAGRNARRGDIVVAVGGGVVGDLAGFAAATYHRGIGLWQVPTSLVAQVDSSVGGKTAINLVVGKNLVGAFYQPDLVVIDPATLATLPQLEYIGALGEVVKHALLSSEQALEQLEAQTKSVLARDVEVMSRVVKGNVWFKSSVVEEDEREAGRRAVLNLGHTTAHALESTLGFGRMNHGQAVALGVLVALAVSEEEFGLDVALRPRIERLMGALGLATRIDLPSVEDILVAAGRDKKAKPGTSGFVGLRAVGEPVWGANVAPETITRALEVIKR